MGFNRGLKHGSGVVLVLPIAAMISMAGTAQAGRTGSFDEFAGSYLPESTGEALARAVAAGDVDKSGKADLVVASPLSDAGGTDAGRAYLFLNPGAMTVTGAPAAGANVIFTGEAGSQLGARAAADDITGDGITDLVISAPMWNGGYGRVYVFFGRTDWTGVTLSNAGLVITGDQAGMMLGAGVLLPGDINGDGFHDLVVSAPGRDDSTTAKDRGAVYVFLGNSFGWTTRALNTADAIYRGEANADMLGSTLASLGDVNGDTFGDWAAGAPKNDAGGDDSGQAYIFLSRTDYILGDNVVANVASVRLKGDAAGDQLGASISGGGDVNADGNRDLIIGGPGSDYNGTDTGRCYIIAGRKVQWPIGVTAVKDVSTISFFGATVGDRLCDADGAALAEVSGDTAAETILLTRTGDYNGTDSGAMYVFLGRSSGWGTANSAAAAEVRLHGANAGDLAGVIDPAGAGDLDADNLAELLIGVPGSDLGGPDSGEVFVGTDVARWFDIDADGYSPSEGDCDDHNVDANPGETSDPRDDVDNDCDGQVDEDASSGCGSLTLTSRGVGTTGAGTLAGFGLAGLLIALRRRAGR